MTVKELKALLNKFPDHMDVLIEQTNTEFQFSLLEKAEIRNVTFSDGKLKAKDNCIVLTDEF